MSNLQETIVEAMKDFDEVLSLARAHQHSAKVDWEILNPHRPPKKLPTGKMAVYAFFLNGRALKVGKAGPKSGPRYCYQHYSPHSAPSSLAKSIFLNPSLLGIESISDATVGHWIQENTTRVNLLVPAEAGGPYLSLLEAFLHFRWDPIFEGRLSKP